MYKSLNQLSTLDSIQYFLQGDAAFLTSGADADKPSEFPLRISPNGQYIMMMGSYPVGGNGGAGGVPDDQTDKTELVYSTDSGSSWTTEIIGRDGITPVANRPGYFPIFENFGQLSGVVDNNGVMHVTANGVAYWIATPDTFIVFPAIYWNSRDRQWLALTTEPVEEFYNPDSHDAVSDTGYTYPGNAWGSSYPIPSVSLDGNRIVVVWQGVEYSGEPGTSNINVFNPTTENPTPIHYSDLYYATSGNGGKTWSAPQILEGAKGVQECYPYVSQVLDVDANGVAKLNYIYMVDAIPGTSLFTDASINQNSVSNDCYWAYNSKELDIPVSVNEKSNLVTGYSLVQNYPNPFNPSTLIKYSIPDESEVTLKVFDMLGKETIVLVNSVQSAGKHEVNFNAAKLSSGLYIYTLTTNNFSASKKMMILK